MKKKRIKTLLVFLVSATSMLSLAQEAKEKTFSISTSCGEVSSVNHQQLQKLTSLNHQHNVAKCPGYFAAIEPEEKMFDMNVVKNNCNKDFPKKYDTPVTAMKAWDKENQNVLDSVKPEEIEKTVKYLSENFKSRFHKSSDANKVSEWLQNQFIAKSNSSRSINVQLVDHSNTSQKSVMAVIKPQNDSNEYIVLGGHLDSTAGWGSRWQPNSKAPGADDNASGMGVLLEVFRVINESDYFSDKNIIFFAYAAEEVGLVGSQEIAKLFKNQNKKVLGVIQFDMTSYSSGRDMDTIKFVTDYTSSNLNQFFIKSSKEVLNLKVETMECGYACSDHASWTKNNFPAIMPAENHIKESIRRIHSPKDVVDQKNNFNYAAHFAKLGVLFAMSF